MIRDIVSALRHTASLAAAESARWPNSNEGAYLLRLTKRLNDEAHDLEQHSKRLHQG
jgi:hypothetical protein